MVLAQERTPVYSTLYWATIVIKDQSRTVIDCFPAWQTLIEAIMQMLIETAQFEADYRKFI